MYSLYTYIYTTPQIVLFRLPFDAPRRPLMTAARECLAPPMSIAATDDQLERATI